MLMNWATIMFNIDVLSVVDQDQVGIEFSIGQSAAMDRHCTLLAISRIEYGISSK
jgi:hypothetical protein